jgi:hypothetical protein
MYALVQSYPFDSAQGRLLRRKARRQDGAAANFSAALFKAYDDSHTVGGE